MQSTELMFRLRIRRWTILAPQPAPPLYSPRYSHSEAQLAEVITYAASAEQRREELSAGNATAAEPGADKRRRLACSAPRRPKMAVWSPLEAVEERSRNDPDWAAVHYRQAWFLQVRCAMLMLCFGRCEYYIILLNSCGST